MSIVYFFEVFFEALCIFVWFSYSGLCFEITRINQHVTNKRCKHRQTWNAYEEIRSGTIRIHDFLFSFEFVLKNFIPTLNVPNCSKWTICKVLFQGRWISPYFSWKLSN